jgi:hypothetical protein
MIDQLSEPTADYFDLDPLTTMNQSIEKWYYDLNTKLMINGQL